MDLFDPSDARTPPADDLAQTQRNPALAPHLRPALFQLGQLVITPGALATMIHSRINLTQLLVRHVTGDWGDLADEAKLANDLALHQGGRILSCYGGEHNPDRLWLLTNQGRNATTIMRSDGY